MDKVELYFDREDKRVTVVQYNKGMVKDADTYRPWDMLPRGLDDVVEYYYPEFKEWY